MKRYGKTRPDKALSSDGLFKGIGIENLAALAPKHSFIEALAALITSAASGLLANPAAKARDGSPQLEVLAFTRATHGRIRISGLPRGVTTVVEYTPPSGERSSETNGDLEQSRRITEHTILAVAKLLEGQRQHGPQRT
ncbi:hypothetical protein [Bradyrhizobium genosp. A]|uniref:hypothetical protein n=1 Tax=Bradyrhizobium genosp. A TaxID=83626 RepID=UPI003CF31DD0